MFLDTAKYLSKEHIKTNAIHAPVKLVEEAARCLDLVAGLVRNGLDFQFKGGNSLLVILDEAQRYSIDVDIATDEPADRIESVLDTVIREGAFSRWEKRPHKTKPWIPLSSYNVFFRSHFQAIDDPFIMLDAQLSRSPYKTERKPVRCGRLYVSDVLVEVPLPASLIGDKLLTLGPATFGIPTGKGKAAQRIKHVFDVATLMKTAPSLCDIRKAFFGCIEHEEKIQGIGHPVKEILDDTLMYLRSSEPFEARPAVQDVMSEYLKESITGHEPFAEHLIRKDYTWREMRLDMARAGACIAGVCVETVDESRFADFLKRLPGMDVAACWRVVDDWRRQGA